MRTIGLYLYASVKGGVGKSTLAVLAAKLLAGVGRRPVVIDADVLGSSLADGLELCAPIIHDRDGAPDYTAPPTGQWHDLAATRRLRSERNQWWKDHGRASLPPALAPAFLNEALFHSSTTTGQRCRVDAMLWRASHDDGVRYLPSSPLRDDAIRIAPHASGNEPHFAWLRRFAWILDELVIPDEAVTDVIVDLPPGTWGLTHETLVLASKIEAPLPNGYPQWHDRLRWRVVPKIVTTPDRNDRLLAMEYWLMTRDKIPALRVLMNRLFESEAKARSDIRADVPDPLRSLGLENQVSFVIEGDLRIDRDLRQLSSALDLDLGAASHA
jgi:hypothetical protein